MNRHLPVSPTDFRPDGAIECESVIGCEIRRREPFTGPDMTPAALNVRPVEQIFPQQAPEFPRQGDTPSRPARYPIATFQSVASIKAVQQDEMTVPLWAPVHVASTTNRLGMNTEDVARWGERANIERPSSEPFGSQFAVENNLQLLMGK